MYRVGIIFFCLGCLVSCKTSEPAAPIYQSETFTLFKDRVVQGTNEARVISSTAMVSNYQSPASETFSRLIKFKFSINEKDNELPPGADHWVVIGTEHQSPIVSFGETPPRFPDQAETYLPTNYEYTFRVDVSSVLKEFQEKGYYEAFDGSRVAQADFKGFYLAGGSEPLTWDFVNLANRGLQLQPTEDPNIYALKVLLNPYQEIENPERLWELKTDISNRPQYRSDQPIVDALFNLSTEEAFKNIEADSTLRTGAKWGGVWTRDVSYSILLAFAHHEPEVAKISLRKKVNRGRIVQDTGSGGAWPVSSDRTTWVLAAWEIYKVTGDQNWLDEIYPIIKNTLEDDYKTVYDPQTGMFSGESSFLDWREQTYPKWMDNKDIYVSQNLGTNAVHYQANNILASIAELKGEPNKIYLDRAAKIKKGINTYLWQEDQGFYAQYLYGRNHLLASSRFEALGEALSIIFDIAGPEQATQIIAQSPLTSFGVTCIYPQIPGIPPYHNNGIWPFVQSYWNWAAAKAGNEAVLNHGLASIYRAAALFLTNYENMVAETGDFLGTEINSDRMLWSMAGNLAMVHRVFLGMDFQLEGLSFNPTIPKAYTGEKTLSQLKYRNTTLNISVQGHGTQIESVLIDGQPAEKAFIPNNWTNTHTIVIQMANNPFPSQNMNLVENHFSPPTVLTSLEEGQLRWKSIPEADHYRVYRQGVLASTTTQTHIDVPSSTYDTYSISAVDTEGYEGFISAPLVISENVHTQELEDFTKVSDLPYTGFSGKGFVEISRYNNRSIQIPIQANRSGTYAIDFRYSNGNGRWNTDNKCAIRSLYVNNKYSGVFVFPQRGQDEWSEWGYSNSRLLRLQKGTNHFQLEFEDWNNNMNVQENTAMLDFIRVQWIGE